MCRNSGWTAARDGVGAKKYNADEPGTAEPEYTEMDNNSSFQCTHEPSVSLSLPSNQSQVQKRTNWGGSRVANLLE